MGGFLLLFGCANLCRAGVCVKRFHFIVSALWLLAGLALLVASALYVLLS